MRRPANYTGCATEVRQKGAWALSHGGRDQLHRHDERGPQSPLHPLPRGDSSAGHGSVQESALAGGGGTCLRR
jgi:hypothetical protein